MSNKFKTGIILWFLFFFMVSICQGNPGEDQYIENTDSINSVDILKKDVDKLDGRPKSYYDRKNNFKNLDLMKIIKSDHPEQYLRKIMAPLKHVKEEDFKRAILKNKKQNVVIGFLSRNPKVLSFFVKLIKDEQALYRLIRLTKQKKLGYIYLGILVASFVVSFILKRKIRKKFNNITTEFFLGFVMSLFFWTFRLGIFVYIFYYYLEPTIKIFYLL